MRRRKFIALVGGAAAGWHFVGHAQQARPFKIVWVNSYSPVVDLKSQPNGRAFAERLEALGYKFGQSLIVDIRSAEGNFDRLPELLRKVVDEGADVIVSPHYLVTQAAKAVTASVPIVMLADPLPVERGIVQSLARPGGNITGLTFEVTIEHVGKRLELCRELFPDAKRLAVLSSVESMSALRTFIADTANRLGFEVRWVQYSPHDFETALTSLGSDRPDVVYVTASAVAFTNRQKIVDFFEGARIRATYPGREYVEAGGLISFGVSLPDLARRGADYVHRILQGARPSELPVERPVKYEFVVNLKAAKAQGITIPQTVLFRADEVIE